jgi:hypothetical protein
MMSSPFHPIRRRRPEPADVPLEQRRENMTKRREEPPTLQQLHLMALLFMRF